MNWITKFIKPKIKSLLKKRSAGKDKTIALLKKADGLVVGSALCKGITDSIKNRQNPVIKLRKMVKSLKSKIQ